MTLRLIPGFAYSIFNIILFHKNVHLFLLYPKHVIKLLWYNLGYYNGYDMFCGLNWEDIVAGGKGSFRDGFGSKWLVLELPRSSLARICVALHPFKPPTLDAHIFLVQTLIHTFLDSMESTLSLEFDHMPVDGIWCSHIY